MAHEGLSFKQTIIAGAGGTILAAVITWLFGYLPKVWSWLSATAVTLWNLVSYPISIPIGIAALFLFPLFWFLANRKILPVAPVQTKQSRAAIRIEPIKPVPVVSLPIPIQLSTYETKVTQLMAAGDGKWMSIYEISRQLNLSNLITEQAVESLFNKRFVMNTHSYLDGTSYRLSSQGRDYAIANGYVS